MTLRSNGVGNGRTAGYRKALRLMTPGLLATRPSGGSSELLIAPVPFSFTKGSKPPLALVGRVRVKVTAEGGAINPGDLLTTSSLPGYAMRADEYKPGAILGKALEPLEKGEGRIRALVTLQ